MKYSIFRILLPSILFGLSATVRPVAAETITALCEPLGGQRVEYSADTFATMEMKYTSKINLVIDKKSGVALITFLDPNLPNTESARVIFSDPTRITLLSQSDRYIGLMILFPKEYALFVSNHGITDGLEIGGSTATHARCAISVS